jgi:integration host factor subunit alpha
MDCVFLTRKRATEIVNTLFETIKVTLAQGDDVKISGFGKFQSRFRWAGKGRHPGTGEAIILKSRRTISFRPSRKLRGRMNQPESGS